MDPTDTTLRIIHEVFDSWRQHDRQRFQALLADDAALHNPQTGDVVRGAETIAAFLWRNLEPFPDFRPQLVNVFAQGEQGVAETIRTGTHTGDWCRPAGIVKATGKSVRLPECILFRIRDGKVLSMTAYIDRLSILEQLGLFRSS